MIRVRPWLPMLFAIALLLPAGPALAAAPDWGLSNGYQSTQTGSVAVENEEEAVAEQLAYDPVPVGPRELQQINRYRAAAGVQPAQINPALDAAAESHVRYYDANRGNPGLAGMGLHSETAGKPEFTGATMSDRARAAGYSGGTVTENAGYGALESALEWYMNSINHRLPLIHPSALDIGYEVSASSGFSIIDVGLRRDELSITLPSVYPGPDATDVPISWDGGETPNPAPGLSRPLGYPITVAFAIYQQVAWKSFALVDPDGQPVDIVISKTDWMRAAAIIPKKPLRPGTTYTVRVEAVADGEPIAKEWTFTTSN